MKAPTSPLSPTSASQADMRDGKTSLDIPQNLQETSLGWAARDINIYASQTPPGQQIDPEKQEIIDLQTQMIEEETRRSSVTKSSLLGNDVAVIIEDGAPASLISCTRLQQSSAQDVWISTNISVDMLAKNILDASRANEDEVNLGQLRTVSRENIEEMTNACRADLPSAKKNTPGGP